MPCAIPSKLSSKSRYFRRRGAPLRRFFSRGLSIKFLTPHLKTIIRLSTLCSWSRCSPVLPSWCGIFAFHRERPQFRCCEELEQKLSTGIRFTCLTERSKWHKTRAYLDKKWSGTFPKCAEGLWGRGQAVGRLRVRSFHKSFLWRTRAAIGAGV